MSSSEQKKPTRRERHRAAKALEAQPLFVNDLLADRAEEARKAKRALFTRSRNRLHLPADVCILAYLPEPLLTITGESQPLPPPVTITVTNPDGLTLYPHDIRTWPASPPTMSSSAKRAAILESLITLEKEIIEIVREAYACPRMAAWGLGDEKSDVRKAIRRMAREIDASKLELSSKGHFPREERRKARRWLEAAYKCYDKLVGVVYHLTRCERKKLDLGLLPARFEQVVKEFPAYGSC
jgi:hypothetical protein